MLNNLPFNDGQWNEYEWEKHISEVEAKSKQLKKFILSSRYDHLPTWVSLMEEFDDELDVVDEFVDRELEIEEAYYPDDDDLDSDDDELDDDAFLFRNDSLSDAFEDYRAEEDDDELDDFEAGEEWKLLSDQFTLSDEGSILNLKVYEDARNVAAACLEQIDYEMIKNYPPLYLQFVDAVMHIVSKVASGYSFGFETEMLGGNLVYTKKALSYSNKALALLQKQKKMPYINADIYFEFHQILFELRNDLAAYVQDLRDKFLSEF